MNIKYPLAVFTLSILPVASWAETYSTEIDFRFSKVDRDNQSQNIEHISLYAEHHFKPVDIYEYPYEEAAFLTKSSYFFAATEQVNPGDQSEQLIGVAYYIPNSIFYAEGAIKRYQTDSDEKGNDFGGALGLRLFDGFLVSTRYWDEEGYDPNVHAKIVHQLAGGNFINFEVGYTDGDEDIITSVAFDAYLDPSFSVGLGYVDYMGDDQFTLRTQKYITNVFHIGAALNKADDEKSIGIEAGIRF